ncbi:MAG: TonB-dependent receptor [Acidobacteria bacterium]|nr:TonB-dependent receptor [Acidobacteriota bacterium]
MKPIGSVRLLLCSTILACSLQGVSAQTLQGDISGIVRDPSGAVVPGAEVTITNMATDAKRAVITDEAGRYHARALFVGTYRIEVQASGFQLALVEGIEVKPAAVVPVDISLQLGQPSETVNVTDEVPVIQSQSATVTYGLDPAAFGKYEVVNSSRTMGPFAAVGWTPAQATGRDSFFVFRGAPTDYTGLTVEGQSGRGLRFRIPAKAQRSAEVVAFSAPAEYERAVTVNTTYKTGTDSLHGSLDGNLQNPVLNAVKTPVYQGPRDPGVSTWRYHVVAGGPVYIPHVYDGRKKTHWFFAYQNNVGGLKAKVVPGASIPTMLMRDGDFSGWSITIKDPLTGQPFPGNKIPASRISQVSRLAAAEFFDRGGYPFRYVGSPSSTVGNAEWLEIDDIGSKSYLIKLDHNFANGDVLAASYTWSPQIYNQAGPQWFQQPSNWYTINLAHTHLFGSSAINQFRVGGTRNEDSRFASLPDFKGPEYGAEVVERYGLMGLENLPADYAGRPQFVISGWNPVPWDTGMTIASDTATETVFSYYSLNDIVTYTRGNHEIKAGFSARKILHDSAASGNVFGSFSFNGKFTGEPYADFLLGYPASFSRTNLRPWIAARRMEYGAFAQDTYSLFGKLILSFGLRWCLYSAPYDKNGLYYNFDLRTLQLVVPDRHALNNVHPAWPQDQIPVRLASELGYPDKLMNTHSDWSPRLGLAFRPSSDWVIRTGYGLYTGIMAFSELQTAGPFQITESFTNGLVGGIPQYSFPSPFPPSTAKIGVSSATHVDPDFRTGYTQNWNLTLEKSLFRNWGARLSYLGYKTTRNPYQYDANVPQTFSTTPYTIARRRFPQFASLNLVTNGANLHYHGFEISANRSMKRGLMLQASYSWNRNVGEIITNNPETQTPGSIDYAWDRARDKGNIPYWTRHDFLVTFVHELPLGTGRRWGASLSQRGWLGKLANGVVGDWAYSGYFNWHSGTFFTPTYSGVDPAGINKFSGRPDIVPGADPYEGGAMLDSEQGGSIAQPFPYPSPARSGTPRWAPLWDPAHGSFP